MDKELISMCDCPEIQEKWEPKDGDRFQHHNAERYPNLITIVTEDNCEAMDYCECCGWDKSIGTHQTYIPRIEDVLEWLTGEEAINQVIVDFSDHLLRKIRQDVHMTKLVLPSLIEYYMGKKHHKVWDGEAWT